MEYPILKSKDVDWMEGTWEAILDNLNESRFKHEELDCNLIDAHPDDKALIAHGVAQSGEEIIHLAKRIIEKSGWQTGGTSQKTIFHNLRDHNVITSKTSDQMKAVMKQRNSCVHKYRILDFPMLEDYLTSGYLVIDNFLNEIGAYMDWQKAAQ